MGLLRKLSMGTAITGIIALAGAGFIKYEIERLTIDNPFAFETVTVDKNTTVPQYSRSILENNPELREMLFHGESDITDKILALNGNAENLKASRYFLSGGDKIVLPIYCLGKECSTHNK